MSETKDLIKLIVLVTVTGVLGLALVQIVESSQYSGDLTADYTAKISFSKVITLWESYTYHVNEYRYKMLYRVWEAPLTLEKINTPCIVLKSVGSNEIPYMKDYHGKVIVFKNDPRAKRLVEMLAERNEVGMIYSGYLTSGRFFDIGDYTLNIFYEIYPPIQTDSKYDHVNLKLASVHVPYRTVKIYVYDPNGTVLKIYPHMYEFNLKKVENGWLIEGESPKGLVEVEFVLKHGAISGFYQNVPNVLDRTEKANLWYYTQKSFAKALRYVYTALVLGFPVLVLFIYRRYGSEKLFTVPEVLSYVPNPNRKPWEVNVVFTGDAMKGDKNAFFATLLDLHRRGAIEIEPYEVKGLLRGRKELRIKIVDRNKFDRDSIYEYQVLRFLENYSEDGVLDTQRLRRLAKDRTYALELADDLRNLFNWRDARYFKQFVDTKGKTVFYYLIALFILAIPITALLTGRIDVTLLPIVLTVQSICCALSPSQLFGRWKEEFYKEKLEWEAFRRFLSDFAMIKKYAPDDLAIWKEWLVYGTALGVGDKVVKAMENLNINIPEVRIYYHYPVFVSAYRTSTAKAGGSGGGGFGGGFGAGGGFGGGGAGGR